MGKVALRHSMAEERELQRYQMRTGRKRLDKILTSKPFFHWPILVAGCEPRNSLTCAKYGYHKK